MTFPLNPSSKWLNSPFKFQPSRTSWARFMLAGTETSRSRLRPSALRGAADVSTWRLRPVCFPLWPRYRLSDPVPPSDLREPEVTPDDDPPWGGVSCLLSSLQIVFFSSFGLREAPQPKFFFLRSSLLMMTQVWSVKRNETRGRDRTDSCSGPSLQEFCSRPVRARGLIR